MSATTAPPTPPPKIPSKSWTVKVREKGVEALPPERLLPDGQPTYVASWICVFGVASIASLSAGLTLLPGDIIATGTPEGVGVGFKPPRYLQAGDVVDITIKPIGTLSNPVA